MATSWDELSDLTTWNATPAARRYDVAAAVARALGDEYEPAPSLRGRAALGGVRHRATGLPFVLVPGGAFEMGVRDAERDALLALAPDATRKGVGDVLAQARPPRRVVVRPFLLAERPVLCPEAVAALGRLDRQALRPDFHDDAASVPCHLTRAEAARFVAARGLRLPSEAEWEYAAREGGGASWLCPAPTSAEVGGAPGVEAVVARVAYDEVALEPTAVNAFGLWGMLFGEWVADGWHDSYAGAPGDASAWQPGAESGTARGGGGVMYPWYDSMSYVLCHAAARHRSRLATSVWGVRPARDLPSPQGAT